MRRAGLALAALWFVGCAPPPEPSTPFRTAPSGPGLDLASNGRLVELLDPEGEVVARARFGRLAARAYTTEAVREGRLRPEGSGWALVNRAADELCDGDLDADGGFAIVCGETRWEARRSDASLTLLHDRSVLGVVRRDGDAAVVEPLARPAIRCEADGSITGATAVRARVPAPPVLSCVLAASLAADADIDGLDAALAWFAWRALETTPIADGTGEGSAR